MIRVVVAEDHLAVADGILAYFKYHDSISIIGHAKNGEDLVKLVEKNIPDVVLTDVKMPVMDGIEAAKLIKAKFDRIGIIAFSMFDQDEAVDLMLQAGATGYLLKNSPLSEMEKAILKVSEGNLYYDPNLSLATENTPNENTGILTKRQIEILKLVGKGKTNQQIADALFIGKTTVETHRKNMIRKLGLHGPGELLRYALQRKYDF
ncbi:response regulator [Zunongwangia profunda]|uniref:Two-component system response regulator n=1 Tax=Zunongwangia profunda (strain DSM 18752 / CCTCC AB 206139 / SM-A87) TaxID=655815 RepID=D5BEQ7_ZUNPS|nr:response regulator transcription factor [Zunongwangia profunda]ADF50786.1 two-component system response regulator [Zunongwangia profunda SM-A87]MAS69776.1 DNA-binding response regulator [Zunongwangia sp.]|tara:strand:+ start:996 stop:1613 length:618 start_codon:yes stop_codon:yes gene_type:complete